MNVAAESLSRARIRKITEKLRELIGCSEKAYFPIVEFIEWIMGDPENDFDYEIVEAQEMQDMYGNMNTGLNVMKIREDVYIGAINGNIRIEKFSAGGIGINSPTWKVIFSNIYKQEKIVHFMAQAYTTVQTVANAEYIVFNLPEELKPLYNYGVTATASDANGNNACACYSNVNTSGALKVKIPSSTCKYVIFNAIWFTD